ncbi:hypothetical protein PCIT_a3838 [Pseudoalteromonas citrea]|uniref:TolC family protein n=2 Tax=Pseudoalteromonas citrea TaxID=43655 RepID=A0AAD4AGD1_9GAMM|nr:TolC family protein [Pseudoalteromonas citrea]KAF7767750.1 hypothetical protein PCIT_a3838 [Pseudoalteromonas citrea]
MKYAKFILYISVIFTCSVNANTFIDLYKAGLKSNLLLKANNASFDSIEQEKRTALGAFLPSVNLQSNFRFQDLDASQQSQNYLLHTPDTDTKSEGVGYAINVEQPLFDLELYHRYDRAALNSKRTNLERNLAAYEYLRDYYDAYLNISSAWAERENLKSLLRAYTEHLILIRKQHAIGLAQPSDLYQVEASLANLKVNEIMIENRLNFSFKRLELILQKEVFFIQHMSVDVEHFAQPSKSPNEYLKEFSQNLDYQIATFDVKMAKKDLKIAKSLTLPKVSASLSYNYNNQDDTFDFQADRYLKQDGLTFSINMTMPLYAGGRDSSREKGTTYLYESRKYQKQFLQHQIKHSIAATYDNVRANIESISARQKSIEALELALENTKTEYMNGFNDYIQLRDSQIRLHEERNQLVIDKTTLMSSYFLLNQLTGTNVEELARNINLLYGGEIIKNES